MTYPAAHSGVSSRSKLYNAFGTIERSLPILKGNLETKLGRQCTDQELDEFMLKLLAPEYKELWADYKKGARLVIS